jgi:hypothetical protein
MTRADVLGGNVDLLDEAGKLLAAMPVRYLAVTPLPQATSLVLDLAVENVEWCDVFVDDRPRKTVDVGGVRKKTVRGLPLGQAVRVDGYAQGRLVASRRASVRP